jgi:rubrerythrin
MSGVTMTISEQILLEKCREIELLCKELYDYFAELYAENEDAVNLWSKTAAEEENHAAQFTMAIRLRNDLPCIIMVDAARVESVILQFRGLIAKVKSAPPKLVDALGSSIKLEKYLAEFHLGCVAMFEDDSYRKMFNAMMSCDNKHVETLQAAYDKLIGNQVGIFPG